MFNRIRDWAKPPVDYTALLDPASENPIPKPVPTIQDGKRVLYEAPGPRFIVESLPGYKGSEWSRSEGFDDPKEAAAYADDMKACLPSYRYRVIDTLGETS